MDIVDKYEYKIKEEQMIKLIKNRDFATAAKIADGIDWRRIRNINTLTNVGSVYAEVGRYEDDLGDLYRLLLFCSDKRFQLLHQ